MADLEAELHKAAEITNDARLIPAADEFQHIGDRWQTVAEMSKSASQADDPATTLPEISPLLSELATLEEAAWSWLQEIA
ncbi:TPA: hypothetical protein DD712_00265 [Candidatus Acetothermia bacterium]|nr:hypothetical protein [Candidatus Acetothermia bacterium]